jgi:hypothetical protein
MIIGKVPCPYCEEEKIKKENYFKEHPDMINYKVGKDISCNICWDTKLIDWVDAVIKPYTFYTATIGYSGPSGVSGVKGIP